MSQQNNIEESKQVEAVRDYLENIIGLMPGHVYWKDLNLRFLGCNELQAQTIGLKSRKDIVGKTAFDVISSSQPKEARHRQADAINAVDRQVLESGEPLELEEPLILDDGTQRIFLSQKVPLLNDKNETIGLLGISIDITAQKEAEEQLRVAKKEAEHANRVKSEFLANMSHDLRTPLSGIIGVSEIIHRRVEDAFIKDCSHDLVLASQQLLSLLNEILEVTKYDLGEVPNINRVFSIHDVFNGLKALLLPSTANKKLDFIVEIEPDIPDKVIGNQLLIHRILLNLLGNAIKFTPSGYIKLTASVDGYDQEQVNILFTVIDTGIGIAPERYDEIFRAFHRISPSYEGTYAGAGLGLYVVKKFVDALGGSIDVQSKVGDGSTFKCWIPLRLN